MNRTRTVLVALSLVALVLAPRLELGAQQDAAQAPAADTSMSYLPKGYPRPSSAWQSTEKAFYENLLAKGRFEVLVVPFQVQEFGFDRATRSLMTAELAMAIGAQKKVPDPYLVARALGDGYRRLDPDDVQRLARKLGVGKIVWCYAGQTDGKMHLTIQQQALPNDPKAQPGPLETHDFPNLAFSNEDPSLDVYHRLFPGLIRAAGFEPADRTPSKPEPRFAGREIPPSPLDLESKSPDLARDAYAFQLLAALAPEAAERARERFAEKSMLSVLAMSPASPDYRALKARALMQLGQRPAALQALGKPDSSEARHLFHLLNGNLPDVQRNVAAIGGGVRGFIARIELNEMDAAYGGRTPQESVDEAKKLALSGRSWPYLAARAFTDWDGWTQSHNVVLKTLLDSDFPVANYTAQQIARGAASLGDARKIQTTLDLSVQEHVRRVTEARAGEWCCRPLASGVRASDYLELLESIGTANLVEQADFIIRTQGSPQAGLDFLNRIESLYRDQPQLTLERARAEFALSRESVGSTKAGLMKSAYEHAFNAYYWEQNQTRCAGRARLLVFATERQDYGYFDNPYASDLPFHWFFPTYQGNISFWLIRNDYASLENSTFHFGPVLSLRRNLGDTNEGQAKFDAVLKSLEGRFAGNPERGLFLARDSAHKADIASAKRYYGENIKSQPRRWDSYLELGALLLQDADVAGASKLFMSYPGFKEDSGQNVVALSGNAYAAGSLLYWSGHFAQATPLYRIAANLETGSDASMSSEIRLNLLDGDYFAAMALSLQRAKRYNSGFAYRDYLGMLHAIGRNDEAWDAFNSLVLRSPEAELWEAPLVGHRKTGSSEPEIANWVAREPMSQSGYGAMYLLRAGVTDRTPTKELATSIAAIERPVLRFDDKYKLVVRRTILEGHYGILGPDGGGTLPAAVVQNYKTTRVNSDLVLFAEAYRSMRSGDFALAKSRLDEAMGLYDMKVVTVAYLLPYYAFTAMKSGDGQAVLARLEKIGPQNREFDYYLARGIVAGLGGKTSDSLRDLSLARHRRPFTQGRPLYTEYQYAEICEWLYEATKDSRYRDEAVSWAKSVQAFSPWFAWPYAMEAALTQVPSDRERAIAMAFYLDPKSERLAKIPKREVDAAVKAFAGRNPFLNPRSQEREPST